MTGHFLCFSLPLLLPFCFLLPGNNFGLLFGCYCEKTFHNFFFRQSPEALMGAGRPSILLEEKYLTLRQFLHFVSKLILASSSNKIVSSHITARKQSLGQGNVFTPVILFTGGEGWLPSMHHRPHDQGVGVCIQGEGGLHPGQGRSASRGRGSASQGVGRPLPPYFDISPGTAVCPPPGMQTLSLWTQTCLALDADLPPPGCRPPPPGHVACDTCWEANLLPP